jgi:ribose transport system permease protein
LQFTPYGRRLHAIGSNRTAATFVGIRVPRCLLFSFIGAGVLAGFAGALLTARQGGGVSTNGLNLVLPAFAGTFLGATTIRPGHYNVFGTIIGLMFVAVSVNGLNLMGIDVWIQPVFNGLALILAVLISGLLHRRVSGRTS